MCVIVVMLLLVRVVRLSIAVVRNVRMGWGRVSLGLLILVVLVILVVESAIVV